jgi:hypothetical protein
MQASVYARNLDNQILARHAACLYLKLGLLVATATGAWMGHSLAHLAIAVFGHLVTAVK